MTNATTEERFWAKVEKTEGCWNWTGATTGKGYGHLRVDGRLQYAHRLALVFAGLDPDGRVADHICHNPSCVRVEHLRLVTHQQNSENLAGAHRDNPSGVRGVSWDKRTKRWAASAYSQGVRVFKRFADLDEAAEWVRRKRLEIHTHNDLDRVE